MRIWGKIWKDSRLVRDTVIEDLPEDTRTHRILRALTEICREFDLAEPIWLDSNIREFQKSARTCFRKDSFIEEIEFDFLEIQVLEE